MVPITYSTDSIYSIFYAPSLFLNTHGYVCTHTHTHTHTYVYTCMCCDVLRRSVLSDSVTLATVARQASLSMRILQARILEWVAMTSSRRSSWPRGWTQVSHIAFFTIWTTKEAQEYWSGSLSLLQGIFLTQELHWCLLPCRQIFTSWATTEARVRCTHMFPLQLV